MWFMAGQSEQEDSVVVWVAYQSLCGQRPQDRGTVLAVQSPSMSSNTQVIMK